MDYHQAKDLEACGCLSSPRGGRIRGAETPAETGQDLPLPEQAVAQQKHKAVTDCGAQLLSLTEHRRFWLRQC